MYILYTQIFYVDKNFYFGFDSTKNVTFPNKRWFISTLSCFKVLAHRVLVSFRMCFFGLFIFVILSNQNACYGCENAENRALSGKVSEAVCKCDWLNVRSYFFLMCEHFGLSVQRPSVICLRKSYPSVSSLCTVRTKSLKQTSSSPQSFENGIWTKPNQTHNEDLFCILLL